MLFVKRPKHQTHAIERRCLWAFVLSALCSGCDALTGTPGLGTSVKYTPLGVPVSLVWNSSGDLTLEGAKRLVTPIGVFELGVSAGLHQPPPEKRYLVMQNLDTGQEEVFQIDASMTIDLDGDAQVTVDQQRVTVKYRKGTVGRANLNRTLASIGPISSGPTLSGNWRMPTGDELSFQPRGTDSVSVVLARPVTLLSCEGTLTANGDSWSGSISFVSANDRTATYRRAPYSVQIVSPFELQANTVYVRWNGFGQETSRRPARLKLIKVD